MSFFVLISLVAAFVPECLSGDLPDYFPRCYRDDPNLGSCILKAANTLRPHVREGIREIKLPAYGPLVVSTFGLSQDSRMVNYTATLWNFTAGGLDNYDFKEIQFDPVTMTFRGKLDYDSLLITTPYEFDGRLLHIPVRGKGVARAALGPINGTFQIDGKIIKKKDVEYYSPTGIKVKMTIEDAEYYFDGLFENEAMARMTNDLINKNSKMITDAVTPALEKISEMGWMRVMKSLTKIVPYDKLFPPSQ